MRKFVLLVLLLAACLELQAFDRFLTAKQKKQVEEMIRNKDYQNCLSQLDGWSKACKKDYSLWVYKGICYNRLGDARASGALEKARELCTDEVERNQVRVYLAEGYYISGQKEECKALCRELLAEGTLDKTAKEWAEQVVVKIEGEQLAVEETARQEEIRKEAALKAIREKYVLLGQNMESKSFEQSITLADELLANSDVEDDLKAKVRQLKEKALKGHQEVLLAQQEAAKQQVVAQKDAGSSVRPSQVAVAGTTKTGVAKVAATTQLAGYTNVPDAEIRLCFLKGNATYMPLALGNEKTHEKMFALLRQNKDNINSGKMVIRVEGSGDALPEMQRMRSLYVKAYLIANCEVKEKNFVTTNTNGGNELVKISLVEKKK